MQMLCKVSNAFSDVHCPVCGQGFLVYWTRQHARERDQQRQALQLALHAQHVGSDNTDVHAPAFQLPDTPAPAPRRYRDTVPAASTAIPVYN